MIRVEESVEISRPVEEVFSYTSNPENFPQWAATVKEVRRHAPGPGPLREGGRFTATQKALGRRFEAPFEIIDYESNRRCRMGRASRRASRRSRAASSGSSGRCSRG